MKILQRRQNSREDTIRPEIQPLKKQMWITNPLLPSRI